MSRPRVLVVWANPLVTASPVGPYGAERVAAGFLRAGCDVRLASPFLEEDPLAALRAHLEPRPALVAVSLRNLDDAVVVRAATLPGALDTRSCLPAILPLLREAAGAVGCDRVLLGGPGFSATPEAILDSAGLRFGALGPGDALALDLGERLLRGEAPLPHPGVLDRRAPEAAPAPAACAFPPGPTPRDAAWAALVRARRGRMALSIASGCCRRCLFCVEPALCGGAVHSRPVEDVAAEARLLAGAGFSRLWLAASELNLPDERHLLEVLRALARVRPRLDLMGFFQPAAVSDALLDAMAEAGLAPEAAHWEFGHLSEALLRADAGPAPLSAIEALVERYLRRGHATLGASVLLGGHPGEDEATLAEALDRILAFDRALPAGLNLAWACGARLYPSAGLHRWVQADAARARPYLHGARAAGGLLPLAFCKPFPPRFLFARVRVALAGARGAMGPMNQPEDGEGDHRSVEADVQRGILRAQAGQPRAALGALDAALARSPAHPEALAQSARLLANDLCEPAAARERFERLARALPPDDPRQDELRTAIAACTEAEARGPET